MEQAVTPEDAWDPEAKSDSESQERASWVFPKHRRPSQSPPPMSEGEIGCPPWPLRLWVVLFGVGIGEIYVA